MKDKTKISKGKLIEKYIGEKLEPLKFSYMGRVGDSWVFERKLKDIIQTISLYEYRFAENMISFELYTNVPGKGIVQAIDIPEIEWSKRMPGFFDYEDEESFIKVLTTMGNLFVEKGMDLLKELSIPNKIEAKNEMYHELYFHHEILTEQFKQRYQIESVVFDLEHINHWFQIIENITEELQKGEFEEAKQPLVEIAAFLGDSLIECRGGEWSRYTREGFESCMVHKVKARNASAINILNILVGGYASDNNMQWVKEAYLEFLE